MFDSIIEINTNIHSTHICSKIDLQTIIRKIRFHDYA